MSEWAELFQPLTLWRMVLAHRTEPLDFAAERLPPGVALDLHEGRAWSSHVGFEVAPGWDPEGHRQLDVRACVMGPFGPGVVCLRSWTDTIAAPLARPRGVVRRFDPDLRLQVEDDEGRVKLRAGPTRLLGAIVPGPEERPAPGSLDAFLLERAWVYGDSVTSGGWAVRLAHAPWRVRSASLLLEDRGPASVGHYAAEPGRVQVVELRRLPSRRRLSA